MSSVVIWMGIITLGLCLLILSAAVGAPSAFMGVIAAINIAIALLGLREQNTLQNTGNSRSMKSASAARYMGLVWIWGAIALFTIYQFILPSWHEWPVFFGAFAIVGALCLVFASVMTRDAEKGAEDETILKLGRYLTMAQIVGTLVAIAGLLIDPDKQFLNTERKDWAAVNIFFFGAIALAALSAQALLLQRQDSK